MRMSRPVKAMDTKKRVRVNKTRIALHGGNLALADFQLTPPFGSSMMRGNVNCVEFQGRSRLETLVKTPLTNVEKRRIESGEAKG